MGNAPRVTMAQIEAEIDEVYFTNGVDAIARSYREDHMQTLSLLTICIIVMKNGMKIVGTSACVSPDNYDAEIGQKVACDDAIRQIWPLLGYELLTNLKES